jgi:hypothetical protein
MFLSGERLSLTVSRTDSTLRHALPQHPPQSSPSPDSEDVTQHSIHVSGAEDLTRLECRCPAAPFCLPCRPRHAPPRAPSSSPPRLHARLAEGMASAENLGLASALVGTAMLECARRHLRRLDIELGRSKEHHCLPSSLRTASSTIASLHVYHDASYAQ